MREETKKKWREKCKGVGTTSTRGMSAEGSLRQWLPTSKHRSRRLYGGIKKGDKKGARARDRGEADRRGAFGFRVDHAFFSCFLHSNANRFSSIARTYRLIVPRHDRGDLCRKSARLVSRVYTNFSQQLYYIAWINERVQEKGADG